MKSLMRKCEKCSVYTLREQCTKCGNPTIIPHPPKFSPDDKYSYLRTKFKHSKP